MEKKIDNQILLIYDHPIGFLNVFRSDKRFISLSVLAAITLFLFVSLAWPVYPGRDLSAYLTHYLDLGNSEPLYPFLMLYRSLMASVLIGSLAMLGYKFVSLFLLTAYALHIFLCYYIGRFFGRFAARAFTVTMLVCFPLNAFFHEFSSDIFLYIFSVMWVSLLVRLYSINSPLSYALLGFTAVSLVLIRPITQVFLLASVFPLLKYGFTREGFKKAATFALSFVLGLLCICFYNLKNYDDFTVARGGSALVPGYKVFVYDRLFSEENGPVSKELSEEIESYLLTKPIYKERNIDLKTFYTSSDTSMFWDLIHLSDRKWGWDDSYKRIQLASFEAIRSHPLPYLKSAIFNLGCAFSRTFVPQIKDDTPRQEIISEERVHIPSSYFRPERSGKEIRPFDTARARKIKSQIKKTYEDFEQHKPSKSLAKIFEEILLSKFPPLFVFILLSIPLMRLLHRPEVRVLLLLWGVTILQTAVSFISIEPMLQYRLPFDWIIILTGIVGLCASRSFSFSARLQGS
jgi:hypothetical protein